ncbi:hypothetical protein BSUW23_07035 [Bacillus spizizenii str. W23]|uniref:Uncharacterized protein n=1 Tax=Bacillus spizizenii (strain ATCC 23059 / NRRL B-14472 / W23) TaxID=655816 RepID=E0U365_BACSH|nr:hypothetical protein BSUW23_07035 [Bacillus spizizenii str. W23]EFG94057.1 hypothetical protein BSU6633_01239 [Bacillus spizizenii ATCC 6633 = JCM 2499]
MFIYSEYLFLLLYENRLKDSLQTSCQFQYR